MRWTQTRGIRDRRGKRNQSKGERNGTRSHAAVGVRSTPAQETTREQRAYPTRSQTCFTDSQEDSHRENSAHNTRSRKVRANLGLPILFPRTLPTIHNPRDTASPARESESIGREEETEQAKEDKTSIKAKQRCNPPRCEAEASTPPPPQARGDSHRLQDEQQHPKGVIKPRACSAQTP
jgi:hypothetical protein